VEKARDALEKFYHDNGYPAVLVNIPEQTVKDGVVKTADHREPHRQSENFRQQIFYIGKNDERPRFFQSRRNTLSAEVQEEIGRINRNQDFRVEPVMTPGAEPGTIDVELKVEDKFPLHGSLELEQQMQSRHGTIAAQRNDSLRQPVAKGTFPYASIPDGAQKLE